jgi:hypothetical protein
MQLFSAGRKKGTIGRQGGINTLKSCNGNLKTWNLRDLKDSTDYQGIAQNHLGKTRSFQELSEKRKRQQGVVAIYGRDRFCFG